MARAPPTSRENGVDQPGSLLCSASFERSCTADQLIVLPLGRGRCTLTIWPDAGGRFVSPNQTWSSHQFHHWASRWAIASWLAGYSLAENISADRMAVYFGSCLERSILFVNVSNVLARVLLPGSASDLPHPLSLIFGEVRN